MKKNSSVDIYELDEFVAIDLETTGLDPYKESIIEISAVKFEHGAKTSVFSYLLDPQKKISPFIEDLTGISNDMVSGKPLFGDVIDEFIEFIGDLPIVGHNIGFDINFIKIHSSSDIDLEINHQVCDTYLLSKIVLFSNSQFSLEAISDYYDISSKDSHRATSDAYNSGLILLKLLDQLILFDESVLDRLNSLFINRFIFNRDLIYKAYQYVHSLSQGKNEYSSNFKDSIVHYSSDTSSHNSLDSIIGRDGILYSDSTYNYRDGQYRMSKAIEADIQSENISIIEAETGLGKTYAYLIPFIVESRKRNIPLIISTYTKSLQEQLFYKDIKNVIELLGLSLSATLLKGRGNYICINRLINLESQSNELVSDFECHDIAGVITWSHYTKSGDIDECGSFRLNQNSRLWNLIKSDVKFCSKRCFSSSLCSYTVLSESIKNADIIVVNHSLFALDSIEKRQLLPLENYFVIDEAHDFFKSTKKVLTLEFDKLFFKNYLGDISGLVKSLLLRSKEILSLSDMISIVENKVDSFFNSYLHSNDNIKNKFSSYPIVKTFQDSDIEFQDCEPNINEFIDNLSELSACMNSIDDNCVDFHLIKQSGLLDLFIQFSDSIDSFLSCIRSEKYISWVKYHHQSNYVTINFLTKDIGKIIGENCFGNLNIGTFCSATITVDNTFEYFKSQLGLDRLSYNKNISEYTFGTPFFLEEQVDFYSFKSDLHINSDEYIASLSKQIFELASFFNKKILVLCTSYRQASQLKDKLSSKLKNIGTQLLVHEKGRSRNSLIRAFRESENAILIGTMAFWEGVDFPGDQLSILMMIRIPFSNPNDPYLKYLDTELNIQGKNSFSDYQVPEACLKMKQGFGRLIRTEFDKGIFIITDPRIYNSSYGNTIINSFPIEPISYTQISQISNKNKIL